jgi:hypothetical protein
MKNKRVIYHEFTNMHLGTVMTYLHQVKRWVPVYLCGHDAAEMHAWRDQHFQDCLLQDVLELRKGYFDYSNLGDPVPIDAEIIRSISKFQLNYLANFADASGWEFSFEERKSFYYDMLKFWNIVI